MKIYNLDTERSKLGRKPKTLKLDHCAIAKLGKTIYQRDEVKDVTIKVGFKNGTDIAFHRCEEEDEHENRKRKMENDE